MIDMLRKIEVAVFAFLVALVIGFIVGGIVCTKVMKTNYENKILTMQKEAQQEIAVAQDKLIKQERQNASVTASLNAKAELLSAEKDKVVVAYNEYRRKYNGVYINATCETKADRTSNRASAVVENPPSACRLTEVAEQSLSETLERLKPMVDYILVCKEYVDAITAQRERMQKEQECQKIINRLLLCKKLN